MQPVSCFAHGHIEASIVVHCSLHLQEQAATAPERGSFENRDLRHVVSDVQLKEAGGLNCVTMENVPNLWPRFLE